MLARRAEEVRQAQTRTRPRFEKYQHEIDSEYRVQQYKSTVEQHSATFGMLACTFSPHTNIDRPSLELIDWMVYKGQTP